MASTRVNLEMEFWMSNLQQENLRRIMGKEIYGKKTGDGVWKRKTTILQEMTRDGLYGIEVWR